jgi:hypothetical protein
VARSSRNSPDPDWMTRGAGMIGYRSGAGRTGPGVAVLPAHPVETTARVSAVPAISAVRRYRYPWARFAVGGKRPLSRR